MILNASELHPNSTKSKMICWQLYDNLINFYLKLVGLSRDGVGRDAKGGENEVSKRSYQQRK